MDRRSAIATLGGLLVSCKARGVTEVASSASTYSGVAVASSTSTTPSGPGGSSNASTSAVANEPSAAPYPSDEPKELLADDALALHDWKLDGDPKISRRAVVLVPRHLAKGERVPLVIALHGLAETVDEESGAYAWVRKYGVALGYGHLHAPETITVDGLGKMATEARCAEIRGELAAAPFRGLVVACPYTPNIWQVGADVESTLDALGKWIFETLLPRLRAECPVDGKLGLDGVSLGGYASLAIGVRRTKEIDALGCVQAAISSGDAERWADRIGKTFDATGTRPLHLLTSTLDAFRAPVEALDKALAKRAIVHDFRLAIGPHDQPFLRGPGSLEMLHWHARKLV